MGWAASRGDYTAGLFLGCSHTISRRQSTLFHIAQDICTIGLNKRKPEAVKSDRAFSAALSSYRTGVEFISRNWLRYRLGTDIGVVVWRRSGSSESGASNNRRKKKYLLAGSN